MKRPFIVLAGPTAAGKTELSIALAKSINGEIISADSMQVYKGMNIGSAKIKPSEMQGVTHYLIDEFEPDEEFHVVRFQEYAKRYMEQIYAKGKIPILTGGTGFYIQAILYDIDFTETACDTGYREELESISREQGALILHEMLKQVDEKSAKEIHPNNVKRVIRALEYYHDTKQPISEHNEQEKQKESPYNFAYFVLNDERSKLYERIEQRVDRMVFEGLIEEVMSLKQKGYTKDLVSMQGLGYKEILDYLNENTSLEEAIYILKRDTRHFAKRQLTWFKRERDVCWIQKDELGNDNDKILQRITDVLKEKKII